MAIIPKKNDIPTQDAKVRAHNFKEVALGYTEEIALAEADRCLNCKNQPCVAGCPVNIRIPDFINKIKEHNFEGAYQVISESSSLPAVCGRVCPQESQCESKCTLGIKFEPVGIGRLERFVADWHNANDTAEVTPVENNGHMVAVVGSGPSGLTCAGDLAKKGYKVTVFEALHTAGGVLVYGIPEFRLPKAIVAKEVETLKKLGVEVETDVIIGKTLTIDELFDMGFEAVFIGSGAGLPNFMNIPGESYKGVYSANEFLTRSNLMKAYNADPKTPIMKGGKVAVVGGGNVAMDAARTALRLGADKVYIVYRRSMEELPARREEVEHAEEEGIEFRLLCNPTEILGYNNPEDPRDPKNGFVTGISCVKMELGEPDASGRRRPVAVEGSEFTLDVDTVVMSIGTSPNPLIKSTTKGLEVNKRGGIIVNEDGLTSRDNVYAGGDAVTGAATVISAMGAGKVAAKAIDEALCPENANKENVYTFAAAEEQKTGTASN
ncbi:MAG: NADPH-dependent glutamate synthase [Eubacteriales bacterium]|nr:NADPH-dependent glutamate synthase [Eubacteriales bacterium]